MGNLSFVFYVGDGYESKIQSIQCIKSLQVGNLNVICVDNGGEI